MKTVLIGGGSASGKTTLATDLCGVIPGAYLLPQDRFYHCRTQRSCPPGEALDFDVPEAIDWLAMAETIAALSEGREAVVPNYDYVSSLRTGEETLSVRPDVLIVEGTMVLGQDGLRDLADTTLYVRAPEALRRERRMARDVVERKMDPRIVSTRLETQVFPAHNIHVAPGAKLAKRVVEAQDLLEDLRGMARKLAAWIEAS